MSLSRTFHWEWGNCKSNHGSNQLEWGCQNDKEWRHQPFFVKDHTCLNKDHVFWAALCMWWCRPWRMETDPACLMAWVSWIPILRLPQGASELYSVVKNLTTAPVTLTRGVMIAQVVAANAIPKVEALPGILERLDEMQGMQRSRMLGGQRKEALF